MNITPLAITFSLLLMGGSALADDDCDDPVADWQPREKLRQKLEAEGWTVHRIKVDDGCYEVKGKDPSGNRVEAEYSPATFELMEIERDDDHRSKSKSNKESPNQDSTPRKNIIKGHPTVTVK